MIPRVTIVDYGAGNLHSVVKALVRVGAEPEVAESAAKVATAEYLILPGVGAFGEGMAGLARRGLIEPLRAYATSGRPLLGICLGAQLLMEESEEFGRHQGLGIIPGRVVHLPSVGVKIPHVGWGKIFPLREDSWKQTPLMSTPPNTWVYFVHSYHCAPTDPFLVCALATYGEHSITAAVRRDAVTGMQFHPEKSGVAGLSMLRALLT